ncbi:hypothetical protein [Cellulomonas denverensis]|uniref:hypothetical protein n=1 Tax=Cellulomonas denverensis TaxID=264297 RepID=UPI0035E6FDB3
MEKSIRPLGLRRDVEALSEQVEIRSARADDPAPAGVDADIWARHLATAHWTQLSLGILGTFLGRPGAHENLIQAERGFRAVGDPFWLACALLGRTAGGGPPPEIESESTAAVLAWLDGVSSEAVERTEMSIALRADDAATLLHIICAREQLPVELLARAVQTVRSTDPNEDRRLSSLRAVASRRPSDPQNAASLRSLIWGAIASGSGPFDQVEVDDPRVDPATVFDPITVAACVAVLEFGDSWRWLTDGPMSEPRGGRQRRPRGWLAELSLDLGEDVYRNYLDLLRRLRGSRN